MCIYLISLEFYIFILLELSVRCHIINKIKKLEKKRKSLQSFNIMKISISKDLYNE